jgi:hypothetical protein
VQGEALGTWQDAKLPVNYCVVQAQALEQQDLPRGEVPLSHLKCGYCCIAAGLIHSVRLPLSHIRIVGKLKSIFS